MLASMADSGLDLVASVITFFVVRYAATPPDREHRFGHGKAEAFAGLIQGGLVFASAALVGREAVVSIITPQPLHSEGLAIGVMVLSVAMTGLLITLQGRALKKTSSVAVSGDRAHYAADLASNRAAFVGLGAAALTGMAVFDAVAGLAVTAWLIWGAIGVFRQASLELMDHELPDADRALIKQIITSDPRISNVHNLRTRASGPVIHMQLHADLDPDITLVEAHEIVVAAEERLLAAFPAADILIHPDPHGKAEPHGGHFREGSH